MKILVFCEQRDGVIKTSSFEALTAAHMAHKDESQIEVAACLFGLKENASVDELYKAGASKVYSYTSSILEHYNSMTYADAMSHAVSEFNPELVLGLATPMGKDLFARVAARKNAGLLTDLSSFSFEGDKFSGGLKPMYAGKVLAEVGYSDKCQLKMATIRPNTFAAKEFSASGETVIVADDFSENPNLVFDSITKSEQTQADLTEASIIISGGRSLGSKENFKVIEDCAKVLGATVGASRAAVDAGYADHSMQVGQTGKTVNPNLYIACGISGAIQHMAGMKTSKVVIAINTDSEAPIFSIADYGIVGDLFDAVPLLTKKLEEVLK